MKKKAGSIILCFIICMFLLSCQEDQKEEQDAYHFVRNTLYTVDADSALSYGISRFQYHDSILYALAADDAEEKAAYKIVTIDLSSGEQTVYLDEIQSDKLGTVKDFAFDKDDNLWMLFSDETQYHLAQVIDGKIALQTTVDYTPVRELYWYNPVIHIDNTGRIFSNLDFDNMYIINQDGKIENSIPTEDCRVTSFVEMGEKIYAAYSGEAGFCLSEINQKEAKLESPYVVSKGMVLGDISPAPALQQQFCYYDTNGVNGVDEEGIKTQMFAWTEHGWGESYPDRIYVTEEGDILCCRWDEIVVMKRVAAEEGDQRQKLTLAAFDTGEALKYLVADFNKTSETHLIQLVDYNLHNTDTDKYAGLTKLNTEIIGGNPPDMMDLRNIDAHQYIEMGVLENLYPYMDEDSELNQEDYLPNVLKAMGNGEALYGVTTTFRINTVAAKTANVQLDKWNLKGLQEMLAENPQTYLGSSKMGLLELACNYMQDHFVNWEENSATFDSPEFLSFLEACSVLPEEAELRGMYEIYFDDPDYPASYSSAFVSDFSNAKEHEDIWGEPISYIGFPESGSTVSLRMHVGMLSGGSNKEAAWSFLRTALLPKAQMENAEFIMGFPVSKTSFEQAMERAMISDQDGTEYLVDATTGESMEMTYPTQEQVSKVAELAKSTDKLASSNTVIKDIVMEEAMPYFEGDKTAEETAAVIQNRVTIYMNEQIK